MRHERPVILIVDDDPSNVHLLEKRLLAMGYDTISASSAREALEICRSNPPELVLLDVMMPDMDGFQVCEELRRDPHTHEIPVIFVTVRDAPEDKVTGLRIGNDYITKPFDATELGARIDSALRTRRLQEELQKKNEQLQELSIRDQLTGLYNRRYLMERLHEEVARVKRYRYALTLLMMDIDHFKQINDRYGHLQGDRVLQELAQILRASARAVDFVARYGGEEFVMVAPNVDGSGGIILAERIRLAVEQHEFPCHEGVLRITISIGLASVRGQEVTDETDLLNRADKALYEAKERGRNRVVGG